MSGGEDIEASVLNSQDTPIIEWLKNITSEQRLMREAQTETNVLLREDINTTKGILNQHIIQYNEGKVKDTKKFNVLFSIVRSRDDYFKGLRVVLWAIAIVSTGLLTTFGSDIYKKLFDKPAIVTPQSSQPQPKPITKDLIE